MKKNVIIFRKRASAPESDSDPASKSSKAYDPKKCTDMTVKGHCNDKNGGAWSYKTLAGTCAHTELTAPRDRGAVAGFIHMFPDVESVLDFGGGLGPYLLSFRDKGVKDLVVMEPQPLGDCLFKGLTQDTTDLINTDLKDLPKEKFDLVMTIEVLEHIPAEFHPHAIDALAQATKKYLLFSAAHPGQPGEGHVGPSMKSRQQWLADFASRQPDLEEDNELRLEMFRFARDATLKKNVIIFRKKRLSVSASAA